MVEVRIYRHREDITPEDRYAHIEIRIREEAGKSPEVRSFHPSNRLEAIANLKTIVLEHGDVEVLPVDGTGRSVGFVDFNYDELCSLLEDSGINARVYQPQ